MSNKTASLIVFKFGDALGHIEYILRQARMGEPPHVRKSVMSHFYFARTAGLIAFKLGAYNVFLSLRMQVICPPVRLIDILVSLRTQTVLRMLVLVFLALAYAKSVFSTFCLRKVACLYFAYAYAAKIGRERRRNNFHTAAPKK